MHTKNLIRQYTWKDYYEKDERLKAWIHDPANSDIVDLHTADAQSVIDRMHVDHCIEALRLQLMCNADVTPLLIAVDDGKDPMGVADFNTHHKCRNWDQIVAWQDAHNIEMEPGATEEAAAHGHPGAKGHGGHEHMHELGGESPRA